MYENPCRGIIIYGILCHRLKNSLVVIFIMSELGSDNNYESELGICFDCRKLL